MTPITDIITKTQAGELLIAEEIATLFAVPIFSQASAQVQLAARHKSLRLNKGLAEVHAQVGLNISPCPKDCRFCAFAVSNHVFSQKLELSTEQVVERCLDFQQQGANAIFLMATGDYPFAKFIETGQEVRKQLAPETVMVANIGDFQAEQAKALKDAGFSGIYHAVRLGEEKHTKIPVSRRLQTFAWAREFGLRLGTCVEPVGPEHEIDELVEKTIITQQAQPCYSGSARRIILPGTEWAQFGQVSEARMAHIVAVVRLALPDSVAGNCTHEPNSLAAAVGANLFWAEAGANPRDAEQQTEKARGMTVAQCRKLFEEAEIPVLDGPSTIYRS